MAQAMDLPDWKTTNLRSSNTQKMLQSSANWKRLTNLVSMEEIMRIIPKVIRKNIILIFVEHNFLYNAALVRSTISLLCSYPLRHRKLD
jgi:hypothetical protein